MGIHGKIMKGRGQFKYFRHRRRSDVVEAVHRDRDRVASRARRKSSHVDYDEFVRSRRPSRNNDYARDRDHYGADRNRGNRRRNRRRY